jgi:tripartite-type tricarboxylate transporter receptor subunit TctC
MKFPRRRFLHLAAGAAALPAASRFAWAQTYPTRPVRLISGFAAGGTNDLLARLMGQWLSERLGQPFVVENRLGAGGNIATETVVRAAPDGYTLLLVSTPNAINATLYKKLNFEFISDIAPVAGICRVSNVMLVHPSFPTTTVADFITYAKTNLGKVNMASAGIGSSAHLSGELFKTMTGVNMQHVPYRGEAPALTDLLGGQVQVMFPTLSGSIEFVRASQLRALAVTTATRSKSLPDSLGVPKNTPAEIIDKLNMEINTGLADPKLKALLADRGATALVSSPAEFGRFLAAETEKWGKVIKLTDIKVE